MAGNKTTTQGHDNSSLAKGALKGSTQANNCTLQQRLAAVYRQMIVDTASSHF